MIFVTVYENCGQLSNTGAPVNVTQTQYFSIPVVLNFTLIDTTTNLAIPACDPIKPGTSISLATLPHTTLSVRANVNPDPVGSVLFSSDLLSATHTENTAPYSLCGDNAGIYNNCLINLGKHTVTATPYPSAALGGIPGASNTITFTIIN